MFHLDQALSLKHALAAALLLLTQPASAITYHAVDQSLKDVVNDLSGSLQVRIELSRGESLRAKDWTVQGGAREVVRQLCRDFNLAYVFNGDAYKLYLNTDAPVRVLPMTPDGHRRLLGLLREIYPEYSSQMLRFVASAQALAVRAPEDIYAVIEQAAKSEKADDKLGALLTPKPAPEPRLPERPQVQVIRAGKTD